jgi:hypothetical protein
MREKDLCATLSFSLLNFLIVLCFQARVKGIAFIKMKPKSSTHIVVSFRHFIDYTKFIENSYFKFFDIKPHQQYEIHEFITSSTSTFKCV